MSLRDQPYLPLYIQDYLTDEKLSMCSWASQGVYIKLLCLLHKSEPYGTILLKQNDKQTQNFALNFATKITKLLPIDRDVLHEALKELIGEGCLNVDGDRLFQKRMVRDNEISLKRAEAGKKGGDKTQNFAKAKIKAKHENEYKTNYVLLFNKVITENQIQLTDELKLLFLEWLKYKSEKGQTYKETGLKSLLIKTMADCNSDPEELRAMILYSTAKNYDGLFKEKTYGINKKNNGATPEQVAAVVASKYACDRVQ